MVDGAWVMRDGRALIIDDADVVRRAEAVGHASWRRLLERYTNVPFPISIQDRSAGSAQQSRQTLDTSMPMLDTSMPMIVIVPVVMMFYTRASLVWRSRPFPDYPALQYGVGSVSPSQLFGLAKGSDAATLLLHGFAPRAPGLTVCRVVAVPRYKDLRDFMIWQDWECSDAERFQSG